METQNANQQISQEKFTISSDKNNSFNLIFQNRKSTIYISASFQSEIKKIEYEKNYNLEELKTNKYLSLFDRISETYEEIISIIKQKKSEIKLIEKENQIEINIPLLGARIKEINFILNEKEKNDKDKINELYDIISNLKQENKQLKENQKKLEENQKKLEEKINIILNEIKPLKEFKEKMDKKEKEKNENKKIRNLDSLVLGDNEKYNKTLKNWINPNMKIKAELLYRLTRDGDEIQTFHNLCDNKGITLLLVKLIDGNILGGYITKDWDNHSNCWKQDQDAFVFSLTQNVKCITNSNDSYNAFYCHSIYGPYFGPMCFYEKKMNEAYIQSYSYYNNSSNLYPGKKAGYYKTQEVEVYKIIIN
jgi:hypothetical protein